MDHINGIKWIHINAKMPSVLKKIYFQVIFCDDVHKQIFLMTAVTYWNCVKMFF